jgi:hypothetical protein
MTLYTGIKIVHKKNGSVEVTLFRGDDCVDTFVVGGIEIEYERDIETT